VLPESVPLQPDILPMMYPLLGVTVSVVVLPEFTAVLAGDIVPPFPAVAVTVNCATKLAVTAQLALLAPVV
jgi:hypothetical protein